MNLTELSDAELESQRLDVLNEIERRSRLAAIPAQVKDLTARYLADGGERETVAAAVAEG